MTELGRLMVENRHALPPAVVKVHSLAGCLGLDRFASTRFATAFSELCRSLLGPADGALLAQAGIERRDHLAVLRITVTPAFGEPGAIPAPPNARSIGAVTVAASADVRGFDVRVELPATDHAPPAEALSTARALLAKGTIGQIEAALASSERRLRAVLHQMADGLVIIDPRGQIERFNQAAEAIFGYTAEEVSGKNVSMLMPEPHRGRHDSYLAHYLETGDARIVGKVRRLEARRRDGSLFPIELSVAEVGSGGDRQFVGMIRDVTERRREEAAIRDALQAAEAANSAKSQFLANTTHELRTPLNAIIGYAELLIEEAGERGGHQTLGDVSRIHAAANQLLDLVNNVLDLAKIEAGKTELAIDDVDVVPLLESVVHAVRSLMDRNGNRLETYLEDTMGRVRSDPTKLRQIALNLLGNAAKFTRDGTVRLHAYRERRWLVLSVEDTGVGMSEEFLSGVFEPFAQVDGSITQRDGGTGLGLAITRHYCQVLGGRIEVESVKGAGTRFVVRLPAEVENAALDTKQAPAGHR